MLANEQLIKTKNNNKTKYTIEKIAKNVFMISALIAVISLLLIIGFVFIKDLHHLYQRDTHL